MGAVISVSTEASRQWIALGVHSPLLLSLNFMTFNLEADIFLSPSQ